MTEVAGGLLLLVTIYVALSLTSEPTPLINICRRPNCGSDIALRAKPEPKGDPPWPIYQPPLTEQTCVLMPAWCP